MTFPLGKDLDNNWSKIKSLGIIFLLESYIIYN